MVRGHVNDQVQSTWIATDNAHEFWEDRMSLALDDVARQFEEWACNQKKSMFINFSSIYPSFNWYVI